MTLPTGVKSPSMHVGNRDEKISGLLPDRARQEVEAAADGSDIGGHPFLAKPVDPEKVVECIERNLRR